MDKPRYVAKMDRCGTWSVVDNSERRIARMRGVPLVSLGRDLAIDMAALLVIEDREDRPDELG